MKKSRHNSQYLRCMEFLCDRVRPITNLYVRTHNALHQPTQRVASANPTRCISQSNALHCQTPDAAFTTTTGFARRALLLLTFFVAYVGSAWGQTLTKGTPSITKELDLVITNNQFIITGADFQSFLGQYPQYVRFSAYNNSNEAIAITKVESDSRSYASYGTTGYVYTGGNQGVVWSSEGKVIVTLAEGTTKLECYMHLQGQYVNGDFTEPDDGTLVIYEIPAIDEFNGTYSGSEPTPITHVVENVENTTATITFNPTISNANYARFVLEIDGSVQSISSSSLTLGSNNGQTAIDWPKRGIYVYNPDGLTEEDLTVTVSLEAGTFPEYQLVAYFSDEAPTLAGTTITKEPENLKEKQIYSFSYPVKTVDVYFKWDASEQKIDLSDYLEGDLRTLLGSPSAGYIAWSVYNGPYGIGTPIDIRGIKNAWETYSTWAISLNDGSTKSLFYIDDPTPWVWSQYIEYYSAPTVYTPDGKKFSDYPDYVIVCEVSDESKNNIKVRYIFHFNENGKVPFPGKLIGVADGMTQKVDRLAESVPLDLANGAFKHEKLTNGAKYARFYVIDANGDFVNPTGLTVTYDGGVVMSCTKPEQGYYIYQEGGLTLSNINISYANPKNYKSYRVVGVFATDLETAIFENGMMAREPDWNLQYTYSFTYEVEETKEFAKTVEWTRTGMIPEASVGDPDTEWNISWEELSVEQYVKWYVVDADGKVQPLVSGGKATDGAWTITASAYTVAENVAVLTGQSAFLWNTWGCPTVYAPADADYETVKNYQFICEIYSNSTGDGKPNAKYTFTFKKNFLGELKVNDDSHQGGEIITIGVTDTNKPIPLSNAQQAYNGLDIPGTLKYVRVWLTTLSGTLVDPTGKLTVSGTSQYETTGNTDKTYGYYLTSGFNLSDATLTLNAETYNQYQVHVAFSTDGLTDEFEPDYDYVYTFSFNYAMKMVHKVLVYDSGNSAWIPNLLGNSSELLIDCDVDKATLQNNLYVRWYLTDEDGNVINESFNFDCEGYTNVGIGNGYCRKGGFSFPDYSGVNETKNNPKITLPDGYDYKTVRIVCVATTKTEGYSINPWNGDPREIQVKYIYTLYTEDDVKGQDNSQVPRFVHYQGEAYRYLIEEKGDIDGAKQRDYIKMGGKAPIENYTWNIFTNKKELTTENIRQSVHTWEYDLYFIPGSGPQKLILPFQYYTIEEGSDNNSKGQNQEPQAYIRWYDWNTDKKVESDATFTFTSVGEWLKEDANNRGLFYIFKEKKNLWHGNIGVTFDPKANFSETIDIACDVSKYSDGMVEIDGIYYLLREPTLSTRYIFHIHPASEMADRLEKAKQKMEAAEKSGDTEALFDIMSQLEEDKGKVIVSLGKDMVGNFSLRFDQPDYANYILKKSSGYAPAVVSAAQWYAYYENNGTIEKKPITDLKTNQSLDNDRIFVFSYDEFKDIGNGKQYHVVGYVGDGSGDITPVAHYELHFIEAPPILIDDLINKSDIHKERTYAYMNYYYDRAGLVDFDGNPETNPNVVGHEAEYYSTSNWYDAPTSPADNMTYVPFQWDDIQYGFCYPKLTPTIKDGWSVGAAPDHGDYIVLKSMNDTNASPNSTGALPYGYGWWNGDQLYDYTYYLTKSTNLPLQYGSFLYTDASDEARSIATIPFNASLCNGSSIYFTAFVADKTNGYIYPQLLIRIVGIREDGTRERIMAFHTGILDSQVGVSRGKWYQIYSASTMPTGFDPSITHFEAEIINYACGSTGADFAIDQIVIYTSNTKVLLTQTSEGDCDTEEENTVKVYMEAEGLQSAFDIDEEKPQPIYWRVCEEGTDKVVKAPGMYPRYSCTYNEETGEYEISETPTEDNGNNEYGVVYVYVKSNYSKGDEMKSGDLYGWYYDEKEGKYYFQIADKSFEWLERGKNYYVSVYSPQGDIKDNNEEDWGNPMDICSIYSEFFIPRRQYVTFIVPESDGKEGGEITIPCGSSGAEVSGVVMVLKVPDDNQISGFKDEYINFDYILCSKSDWDEDKHLEGSSEYTYSDLREALSDYRTNPTYKDIKGLQESYNTETNAPHYAVLKYAVDKGILLLDNSPTFTHNFNEVGTHYVICVPTELTIGNNTNICGPFEVIFKLKSSGGPSLTLGFEDVDYTGHGNIRVVRVGKEQLRNMQENGYLLHIPVNMFKKDVNGEENEGAVVVDGDYLELLPNNPNLTTDLNVTTKNEKVAKFEGDNNGKLTINSNRMYISLNFHGAGVIPQTFHEGFTYHMFFQVKAEGADDGACEAPVEFLIKVVPEFVTWKGSSSQWNDDNNWSRSTRAELYKGENQNTETKAHPEGYKDNNDLNEINTDEVGHPAFVPMKFTYVTVPSVSNAPNLSNLEIDDKEGIYKSTSLNDNIRYDLMVRYTEDTCIDPKHSEIGTGNIYDCEKFYGNWAKEIYFKPEAELVNQHYLTYEKVWVEKELTAGKWTLMSTPLQNTYAGDMYVPAVAIPDYSSSDLNATAIGKQVTEAFKEIRFTDEVAKDEQNINLYSRTKYPIYQRSWGKKFDSNVYTQTNDTHRSDYSANLGYDRWSGSVVEWSHTYNDVQVPYSTRKGFAIRAHKSDYNNAPNALLRLPKEDKSYDYYLWDGTNNPDPSTDNVKSVSKSTTGKLFTDNTDNINGVTYGVEYGSQERTTKEYALVEEPVSELQNVDGYLLVGNPYLCSINMTEFFNVNTILTGNSWIYDDNEQTANPTKIMPLQSFFVKLKDNSAATDSKIQFTSAMMTDGNNQEPNNGSRMFALTASNDRGQSVANVSVGEEAKSVETLFDSNLDDVPMVYTVADGQAVSINQVTELDKPIAFGVTCTASDEPVAVTFSDIEQLTSGEVYVVDAVTGEQTAIAEGSTLTVQPNDYGRYFLLGGTLGISDKAVMPQGIVVSMRGRVVTVTSGEVLTEVRALSPDGATAQQATAGSKTASLTLATPGVYIIKAVNVAGEQQTAKVIIR